VRRHGMKLLICIVNDGGYGAETHKFRGPHGVDPTHATHGRGDLAQVARGFGLNGTKVTSSRDCSASTRRRMMLPCGTCMSTI